MIFRKEKINDSLLIRQAIADLGAKVEKALTVYEEKTLSTREFDLLDEQSKIQDKMIDKQEKIIKLNDEIKVKDKVIENLKQALDEQGNELKEHKEKVKNLSLDYSKMINYKSECEELKKENTKLQKKLDKLEVEGVKVPTKVRATGPTKETRQPIGTKSRMTGVAVAKIQKEISENNLKEAKQNV